MLLIGGPLHLHRTLVDEGRFPASMQVHRPRLFEAMALSADDPVDNDLRIPFETTTYHWRQWFGIDLFVVAGMTDQEALAKLIDLKTRPRV